MDLSFYSEWVEKPLEEWCGVFCIFRASSVYCVEGRQILWEALLKMGMENKYNQKKCEVKKCVIHAFRLGVILTCLIDTRCVCFNKEKRYWLCWREGKHAESTSLNTYEKGKCGIFVLRCTENLVLRADGGKECISDAMKVRWQWASL